MTNRNWTLIIIILLFCKFISAQIISVKGTGQTTGHIATISIENNTESSLSFVNSQHIGATYYYIPTDGKYQSYVAKIPYDKTISPGETVTIPVYGYCTNVQLPPVPDGENMIPFDKWIGVSTPVKGDADGINPTIGVVTIKPGTTVSPFEKEDIPKITGSPGYKNKAPDPQSTVVVTFPGTDTPIGGTIDPSRDPEILVPLIVEFVKQTEDATPLIQASGDFKTPFANTPSQETETIIQQTVWFVMGIVTGNDYKEEDFTETVYTQFEENTSLNPAALPTEEKSKLDAGIDAFWGSFVATGIKAKILKKNEDPDSSPESLVVEETKTPPPEKPNEPPPEEINDPCTLIQEDNCTKDTLDYDIADTGTKDMNEESKKKFGEIIRNATGKFEDAKEGEETETEFRMPALPASAYSLWFPHAVGGRANATAFGIDLENPLESAMSTDPLSTKAEGNCEIVWTHITGKDCTSTLIGINLAKVRASSALSATMTNVGIAEVVNFVGEVAIDFLIKRGKGTAKKLGKYLKEKAKDLAKDKAKEMVKEELKRLAEELKGKSEEEVDDAMDKLLEEIESGESGEDPTEEAEDFIADWLAEIIVEGEEFNPADKIEGMTLDKIDSPADWSPIKTNTYALADGSLEVWVENSNDKASAASGARYVREEFESREEAEYGGGVFCEGALASDVTSGSIKLKTIGEVKTMSGASGEGIIDTGHGRATATLESFNGMYIVAICECPDATYYASDISVTYLTNEEIMGKVWREVFKNVMNEEMEEAIEEGLDKEDFQQKMLNAAKRVAASALRCK